MSGEKQVGFNTRERAVSNDFNRAQAFSGRALAELLRHLLDTSMGTDDLDAGAKYLESTVQGTPLRAEVINGLLVAPVNGSLTLTVSSGLLVCVDPDVPFNADNGVCKYVADAGIDITTGIPMTGNSSGSTRIDVVECQRVSVVSESDNRDVFNPITGLFTATTIAKATESRLIYRARLGTPGAGFPGAATGWLPLCVASVPDGATSNDAITFWDVRPMLNDRPSIQNVSYAASRRLMCRIDAINNLGAARGVSDHILGGRRVGGRLRRGTPGVDAENIDLNAVANWSPDMAASPDGSLAYLYLCTPFGLPRWARYTDAPGARVPRSPRGIACMSPTRPDESGAGTPTLPASLGFGAVTSTGVAISTTVYDGAEMISFADSGTASVVKDGGPTVTGVITPPNLAVFTFTAGVDYPPHAREILVSISIALPVATPPVIITATTQSMANSEVAFRYVETIATVSSGEVGAVYVRSYWMPIAPPYPNAPSTVDVQHVVSVLTDNIATALANVIGWRY